MRDNRPFISELRVLYCELWDNSIPKLILDKKHRLFDLMWRRSPELREWEFTREYAEELSNALGVRIEFLFVKHISEDYYVLLECSGRSSRLEHCRLIRGMTAGDVARATGLSVTDIVAIERREMPVTPSVARLIEESMNTERLFVASKGVVDGREMEMLVARKFDGYYL